MTFIVVIVLFICVTFEFVLLQNQYIIWTKWSIERFHFPESVGLSHQLATTIVLPFLPPYRGLAFAFKDGCYYQL